MAIVGTMASMDIYERLLAVASEQAEDETLWFITGTAPEAHLQEALRRIHAIIESEPEATLDPDRRLARARDRLAMAGNELGRARLELLEVEHALKQAALAARPWRYVTEELPRPNEPIRFWIVGDPSSTRGTYDPGWDPLPWLPLVGASFNTDPQVSRRTGLGVGEVYAFEYEPEAPPLPAPLPEENRTAGQGSQQ